MFRFRKNKSTPAGKTEPARPGTEKSERYRMRLFIAGDEPNSVVAQKNLRALCNEHFEGRCDLKVIDVFENFMPAVEENILVTPALVIDSPKKIKIFGNLDDTAKVLAAVGIV